MGIFFWRWGLFWFFKEGNTSKPSLETWAVIFLFLLLLLFLFFPDFLYKECLFI